MLNIARGNEIASSVSGIALVGEMLRSCPSFPGIDRLRLPKTSRGHVSHGAAGDTDAAEEARQDAGAHGHRHPAGVAGRVVSHAGRTVLKLGRNFRGFDRFLWISRRCCLQ